MQLKSISTTFFWADLNLSKRYNVDDYLWGKLISRIRKDLLGDLKIIVFMQIGKSDL